MLNAPLQTPAQRAAISETDCRLRSDVRALEHGNYNLVESEKNRLQRAQRKRRKNKKSGSDANAQASPNRFTRVPIGDSDEIAKWRYCGGYVDKNVEGEPNNSTDGRVDNDGPELFRKLSVVQYN